jgi:hypothetical protein
MGLFDFLRRPDAARDQVAVDIDLEAGVLEACPVCRGIADRQRDDRLPAADLIAHQRFDAADPSIAPFDGDREDLLRRLRSVRDRFGYNCTCQDAG